MNSRGSNTRWVVPLGTTSPCIPCLFEAYRVRVIHLFHSLPSQVLEVVDRRRCEEVATLLAHALQARAQGKTTLASEYWEQTPEFRLCT